MMEDEAAMYSSADELLAINPTSPLFKVYKLRWFMLLLFCLSSMGNAIAWITFSPISDKVEDFYDTTSLWVNMLSILFMAVYIPLVFPASWALDTMGLHFGVLAGTITTCIGAGVRGFGKWSFWAVFIGQLIAAIGQPFILNAQSLIAANWFPANQRALATTIASVSNPIGVGIGMVLPSMVVHKAEDLPTLLYVEAGVVLAFSLPLIAFFRGTPPTPPSASAARQVVPGSYVRSTLRTLSNPNFWVLLLQFSLALGAFNTLATLLNEVIQPYGYSNSEASVLGVLAVGCGILASGLVGAFVDYMHWYKFTLIVCLFCATGSMVMFTLLLQPNRFPFLCVATTLLGCSMTPVLPISLELGSEVAYPVGEAIPSGLLVTSGQISGIGMIFLLNHFIDNGHIPTSQYIFLSFTAVACLIMFFFKEQLNRLKDESKKKKQQEGKRKGEDIIAPPLTASSVTYGTTDVMSMSVNLVNDPISFPFGRE